jgi:hypothetical protein
MKPEDLIDDLRSRINPVYAAQLGTESYERRVCAEVIEQLVQERDAAYERAAVVCESTCSNGDGAEHWFNHIAVNIRALKEQA